MAQPKILKMVKILKPKAMAQQKDLQRPVELHQFHDLSPNWRTGTPPPGDGGQYVFEGLALPTTTSALAQRGLWCLVSPLQLVGGR